MKQLPSASARSNKLLFFIPLFVFNIVLNMANLLKKSEYNQFINECELAMRNIGSVDFPLRHYFMPGVYLREMFVPKGGWITSKVHKTTHGYIVSAGAINVITPKELVRVVAPYTGESKAGVRRMGFVLEDCIWTTIHANPDNCKDIPTLEARLFKTYKNPLLKEAKLEEIQ